MPQGFPPLDPDDFPLGGANIGQNSTSDSFCEQLGLDYEEESVEERGRFYSPEDLKAGMEILRILRDSSTALTKRQLAARLYPKVFHHNVKSCSDEYGRWWNITKQIQKQYVESVARQLRSITYEINCELDGILSRSDQLEYLKNVSLAIPIAMDSRGSAKYVYQGPDFPQSSEILEMFQSWAEIHQAKNSRLLRGCLKSQEGRKKAHSV